jgi:hypothetical protein
MRRTFTLLVLLACAAAFAACAERTVTTDAGNANAASNANTATNAGAANANGAQTNDARQGTGPQGQGIGGTSEANRNATVGGNSNVEPAGVNRNVGATPAANRNR